MLLALSFKLGLSNRMRKAGDSLSDKTDAGQHGSRPRVGEAALADIAVRRIARDERSLQRGRQSADLSRPQHRAVGCA